MTRSAALLVALTILAASCSGTEPATQVQGFAASISQDDCPSWTGDQGEIFTLCINQSAEPTSEPTATPEPTATAIPEPLVPVELGNLAMFDGTDDYIQDFTELPTMAITFEAWIIPLGFDQCSANNDCRIVSRASGTAEQDHVFMLSTIAAGEDTVLRFRLKTDDETTTLTGATPLRPNEAYHVAATYDGAAMRIYVNGTLDAEQPNTGTITDDPTLETWLGGQPPSPTLKPWFGGLDEVRWWSCDRGADLGDWMNYEIPDSAIDELVATGCAPSA